MAEVRLDFYIGRTPEGVEFPTEDFHGSVFCGLASQYFPDGLDLVDQFVFFYLEIVRPSSD